MKSMYRGWWIEEDGNQIRAWDASEAHQIDPLSLWEFPDEAAARQYIECATGARDAETSLQLGDIQLTTEHSASSYGIPVAVVEGQAYGPGDNIERANDPLPWLHEPAAQTVFNRALALNLIAHPLVRAFTARG